MDEVENFDRSCNGLIEVRSAVVGGLLLIDLSGVAPDPADHVGDLAPMLERYRLGELRLGRGTVYDVAANWKGIAENYNECLHCPGVHPGAERAQRLPQRRLGGGKRLLVRRVDDAQRPRRDDGHRRRPRRRPGRRSRGSRDADVGSVYYFALFPNALVSLHPDYVMLHTLWPRAVDRTEVTCEWFFEPETMAAEDFDPRDAVDFWDTVNRAGLGRLRADPARGADPRLRRRPLLGRRERRPRVRHARGRAIHAGAAQRRGASR